MEDVIHHRVVSQYEVFMCCHHLSRKTLMAKGMLCHHAREADCLRDQPFQVNKSVNIIIFRTHYYSDIKAKNSFNIIKHLRHHLHVDRHVGIVLASLQQLIDCRIVEFKWERNLKRHVLLEQIGTRFH